jgi:hypothetical protein
VRPALVATGSCPVLSVQGHPCRCMAVLIRAPSLPHDTYPSHRIASHRIAPLDQRIHARLASRVALPRSPPHPSRVPGAEKTRATLHVLVEKFVEMSVEMQQQLMPSRESRDCICLSTQILDIHTHTHNEPARVSNTAICCLLLGFSPSPHAPFTLLPPQPAFFHHLPTTFMPVAGHIKKYNIHREYNLY